MTGEALDDLTLAAGDCLATLGHVETGDLAELYGFDRDVIAAFGAQAIAAAHKARAERAVEAGLGAAP
jgi:hypothetical protein